MLMCYPAVFDRYLVTLDMLAWIIFGDFDIQVICFEGGGGVLETAVEFVQMAYSKDDLENQMV